MGRPFGAQAWAAHARTLCRARKWGQPSALSSAWVQQALQFEGKGGSHLDGAVRNEPALLCQDL